MNLLSLPADRMLNAVQYVLSDEGYGEKETMQARKNVREALNRLSQTGSAAKTFAFPAVDEEQQLKTEHSLPDNVRLLPPAPPPMIPQDGDNPFPHLDPPVG